MRYVIPALLYAAFAAMPATAADAQDYLGIYRVSIFGLPIAESRFSSQLDGDQFRVEGSLRSAGLARIFDRTDGTTQVTGYFSNQSVVPVSYQMSYQSGPKRSSTEILFEKGRAVTISIKPEPKRKGRNWVPLDPAQMAEAVDPLTAALVRAENLGDVCNRTLRVFDGETRADLKLSFLRIRPFSTDGFRGDVVDCSVRFVPVAGYRKTNGSLRYMQANKTMTVSFAPLGDGGVYAPVKAEVGTKIGTVRVYATRFGPAG